MLTYFLTVKNISGWIIGWKCHLQFPKFNSFLRHRCSVYSLSAILYLVLVNRDVRLNTDVPLIHFVGLPLLGGIFCDTQHVWHAKGPCLEVRNTHSRAKVGAWSFGSILKDSNTKIVCVEEIERNCGRISLLAVGLECTITGGLICIFDVLSSTVIRTIHVKEKVRCYWII